MEDHHIVLPAETSAYTTASQPPLPPRNRFAQRSSTWAVDGNRAQAPAKRRGSAISDFSIDDARQSIKSSADDLLFPKPKGGNHRIQSETSYWQSVPLIVAILPAIGGLFFKDGSAFVTDITLLGLAAVFLNWSVRLPWEWYHSTQSVRVEPSNESERISTIREGDNEDEGIGEVSGEADRTGTAQEPSPEDVRRAHEREVASKELRKYELIALVSCFLGPILGAYMLHTIRSQLSRPSEGLVSNYNLSIFVLAAELRPCSHFIKMLQARTLYLQRVVRTSTSEERSMDESDVEDLTKRLEELEAHVAEAASRNPSAKDDKQARLAEISSNIRQGLQPQLDALNRAVRRYEKRAMTQTIQTEARLQDMEARIKDAFSLAAVAAQRSQRPGALLLILEWASAMFMLPLQLAWTTISFPLQLTLSTCSAARSMVIGPRSEKRRKASGKSTAYATVNGDRSQQRHTKRGFGSS